MTRIIAIGRAAGLSRFSRDAFKSQFFRIKCLPLRQDCVSAMSSGAFQASARKPQIKDFQDRIHAVTSGRFRTESVGRMPVSSRLCISIVAAAVLAGCSGPDNPVVISAAGIAKAASPGEISSAEQNAANAHVQGRTARLTALCADIETRFSDARALKSQAAEVEELGLAVGHDIVSARHKACIAFHAEAAGHAESAYRLFFEAAILSLTERRFIRENGGGPPTVLSDTLHYGVLQAILRLRAAGHAAVIQRAGSEMVTSQTCADLRRQAPGHIQCR